VRFNINIEIGFSPTAAHIWRGWINLTDVSIDHVSRWAGSYQVLSMGEHYNSYVVDAERLAFPPVAGFPVAAPFVPLPDKIRAPSVTGNIGEAVTALVLRHVFRTRLDECLHIKPNAGYAGWKSPDFSAALRARVAAWLGFRAQPLVSVVNEGPIWWPVESKARHSRDGFEGAADAAFRQLIAYWITLPQVAGYGVICCLAYGEQQLIRITILVPDQRRELGRLLISDGNSVNVNRVKFYLHGC
jgi:hypothetical protein